MNARGRHTLLPRAALGLLAVLSLARCDCGPVLGEFDGGFVLADGGRADAGAADASVRDAGSVDAGVTDAGFVDAGVADAGDQDAGVTDSGVEDAGVADAGEPDSGTPDAGFADAGAADAGAKDAGQVATGPGDGGVEECDGVDNNGDGLIDLENDGGELARACPLTLGICATAVSRCTSGAWRSCDYGPNYQITERRCDGLDNDCDGRVDVSWQRPVILGDAGFGAPNPLIGYFDLQVASVTRRPNDLLLTLPNALVSLSDDLALTGTVRFPHGLYGHSELFPSGDNWLRISNYDTAASTCVFGHTVQSDGGFARSADGGEEQLWTDCNITYGASWAAIETNEGWATLAAPYDNFFGPIGYLRWTWFGKDGGYQSGVVDAGEVTIADGIQLMNPGVESWLYTSYGGSALQPSKISRFDFATKSLELLVDEPFAIARTDAPFTWSHYAYSGPGLTGEEWVGPDAGLLTSRFTGYPMSSVASTTGLFALSNLSLDGGYDGQYEYALSSLVGATLQPLATLHPPNGIVEMRVHELGGRLILLTGYETSPGPHCAQFMCPAEDFFAMYVCAP